MFDAFLVPEKTVVSAKGDGAPVDVSTAQGRTFLLLLNINDAIEQESIDVSVWGSADAADWGTKPLAAFPQKFYCGEQPILLDLTTHAGIRYVRAHWEVNRWGRGSETPAFEFSVRMTEIAPDLLQDAQH